jgi:predicted nucleic acid-binding protein
VTIVVDASIVVAVLTDGGEVGAWGERLVAEHALVAPHLLPVEAANMLRRAGQRGLLSEDVAALAHSDLLDLPIRLLPYEPVAPRVWELRSNVTAYDAWYVALAEVLDLPLATLDPRLVHASGPTCEFLVPPDEPVIDR